MRSKQLQQMQSGVRVRTIVKRQGHDCFSCASPADDRKEKSKSGEKRCGQAQDNETRQSDNRQAAVDKEKHTGGCKQHKTAFFSKCKTLMLEPV